MSFFKANINLGNDSGFLAVETEFISDHDYVLRVVEIKQKKSQIDFKILFNDKSGNDQLVKLIRGKSVILLLTGKGVLTKKIVSKSDNIQPEDVLPNANKEDFYFQDYPLENYSFATLIRKQKVDELLQLIKQCNAIAGEIFIGWGVTTITGKLLKQEIIHLPKADLVFTDGQLQEIKAGSNESVTYNFDKKEIPSEILPVLSASVSFVSKQEMISSVDSEVYAYFKNEWKQKSLFQKAGAIVLVSFLLILFGNYLAYNHYSQRFELLQEEVAYKQSEIDLLNSLNTELEEKQSLIGGTGLISGYKVSLLADKVGITVPSTVKLTEMNIQPLEGNKLKKEDKAIFETDKIILKGKIYKSTDINQWVKNLKNDETVKDVVVTHYNQSLNENYAEFELTVNLN